jgi:hypothetical protein
MQSFDLRRFYSFRADANALGGYLEKPFQKAIPTLAPVSLPAVGGFAMARSEAFTQDEIIRCSAAYSHVSGLETSADGPASILVTAVVEGLNILEVVSAERIVAQVSISIPDAHGPLRVSLAGSTFEGLKLAGRPARPILNRDLHAPGREEGFTWSDIQEAGSAQAENLVQGFKARNNEKAHAWAQKRHGWMIGSPQSERYSSLCSLIDGFEGGASGHIVEIPGFGRIILGELRQTRDSAQYVAIRAELGCPITGQISVCCVGGGGISDN